MSTNTPAPQSAPIASHTVRRSVRRIAKIKAVKIAPFYKEAVRFPVLRVEHALIAEGLRFSSLSDGVVQIQIWDAHLERWAYAELNSADAVEAALQLRDSAMRAELMKMGADK